MARRLVIEPHDPPAKRLVGQAVDALRNGEVLAYATDTLYGLGCSIEHPRAAERIYRARSVGKNHRLAILCSDITVASRYAYLNQVAFRLAQRIWPGPYTLVLPATRDVPKLLMTHRRRTVGIRVPNHPVLGAILHGLGGALMTSSAISADGEFAVDADDVEEHFGYDVDCIVDSGPTPGATSTVFDVTEDSITVVREGLGSLAPIES